MSRLRRYVLEDAREVVLRAAKFRKPQKDSFEKVFKLIDGLATDLPGLSDSALREALAEERLDVSQPTVQLLFALATGVGKTKLMGAIISFLHLAHQTKNCLVLAPRTAILEKLEREARAGHPKYLLLDDKLIPEPNLCFRSNLESFQPAAARLNLFVLSPQSITGRERRFAKGSEFRGVSLLDYLRGVPDLVVLVDEAHHVSAVGGDETAAWMSAIHDLSPRLYFGFTATPRTEPGVNTLHTYDLAESLRDGLYTKAVDLIVEPRDEQVSDDDWDHYTIDFALRRLERKRTAIAEFRQASPAFPQIEPVLLICARDTAHADSIAAWLQQGRGLTTEELLVTHSEKARSEQDIARLVSIDQPASRIRVVVNVFQLTEGWDVTNVYVIAPLRAMATFSNAVQTMGRGLRLPLGRRTAYPEIDTLDVMCCGRESFEEIVRQATEKFGGADGGLGVSVTQQTLIDQSPLPTKVISIQTQHDVMFEVPSVERVPGEPVLDFEIVRASSLTRSGATALHLQSLQRTGLDDGVTYGRHDFVASVATRMIAQLSYLSEPLHRTAVQALVERFIDSLGGQAGQSIAADPMRVAAFLSDEIDQRYRRQPSAFRVTGPPRVVRPSAFEWRVPEASEEPVERMALADWR